MADRLDILLGILLDKAAQKDVERGLIDIEKQIGALNDRDLDDLAFAIDAVSGLSEVLEERLRSAREEAGKLAQTGEQLGRVSRGLSIAGAAIVGGIALSAQQYVSFVEKAGIQGDQTADRWIAASKKVKNAQLNLGQTSAQAILPVYEKAAELAEKAAAFVQENPDLVQAALNTGLVVATLGAVGAAVSKGIKIYADFKYLAATAEFTLATIRFQTTVREYLGGVLASKGIGGGAAGAFALNSAGRPYDTKTGRFVSQAAYDKQLTAGAGGGALATAGKAIGAITLYASAVIIGANAGAAIGNALGKLVYGEDYKKQDLKDAALTAARLPVTGLALVANKLSELDGKASQAGDALTKNLSNYDQWVQGLLGIKDATDEAAQASEQYRDFVQEATNAQATQAYIQYRQQEQAAEEQYMAQRAQIVEQGARQIAQIEANYAEQRSRLIEQFAASSAQAVSNFQFQQEQAAEAFAFSEANAVQNFNEKRAEQREAYQRSEARSREDHLREMRKLEEEHNDRVRDLVASRDALGLVKEKRDYERRKRDAEEEYRTERQRRKQDFQRQQRDQEEEFLQERARRRQEFQFRQQQAAEQFAYQQEQAKAQFEERLNQLDEQHRTELSKVKQQNAERLRELDLQYRQEQISRRNAFYDILRDLDANLLNEELLRKQYYARMEADLIAFLESTAGSVPGSNLPEYAEGGYTPGGAIRTHRGEYVLDPSATRAMESLVGGRLTSESIQSFAAGGGSTVINLSLPGGLVTTKMLTESLDKNTAQFLKSMTRGLV